MSVPDEGHKHDVDTDNISTVLLRIIAMLCKYFVFNPDRGLMYTYIPIQTESMNIMSSQNLIRMSVIKWIQRMGKIEISKIILIEQPWLTYKVE